MHATPAARLASRIRSSGPIPFAVFMEEALYGEGGYYRRPDLSISEQGDYVTGSSLSPLFGRSTARLLSRLDEALEMSAELFEAGYGTGAHLESVLAAPSFTPRPVCAWDRVTRPLPVGVKPVSSIEEVDEVDGLIISYELFDALPVHRLVGREDGVGELWVDLDGASGFAWTTREVSHPGLCSLLAGASLAPGQIADLSPQWTPLYRALARRLGRGLLVTCDYGFEREKLLDPRVRRHGTLACYSRQRVHRNPFVLVGEQDLTSHVDFTALREAGEAEGLATVAFTRQARWLTACGLFDELADANLATRREAMALLDGEGMGEEIRVLVQARGIDPERVLDLALLV